MACIMYIVFVHSRIYFISLITLCLFLFLSPLSIFPFALFHLSETYRKSSRTSWKTSAQPIALKLQYTWTTRIQRIRCVDCSIWANTPTDYRCGMFCTVNAHLLLTSQKYIWNVMRGCALTMATRNNFFKFLILIFNYCFFSRVGLSPSEMSVGHCKRN